MEVHRYLPLIALYICFGSTEKESLRKRKRTARIEFDNIRKRKFTNIPCRPPEKKVGALLHVQAHYQILDSLERVTMDKRLARRI